MCVWGCHGLVLVGASDWLESHHPGQGKAIETVLVREGLAHWGPGNALLYDCVKPFV